MRTARDPAGPGAMHVGAGGRRSVRALCFVGSRGCGGRRMYTYGLRTLFDRRHPGHSATCFASSRTWSSPRWRRLSQFR
eukprot:7017104-Prymnesium_polylepis.1